MVAADQWFVKEAEASTRAGSSWEFSAVRNSLQVHLLIAVPTTKDYYDGVCWEDAFASPTANLCIPYP